jgi:hypothetical protein
VGVGCQFLVPRNKYRKKLTDRHHQLRNAVCESLNVVQGSVCENVIDSRVKRLVVAVVGRRRIQQRHSPCDCRFPCFDNEIFAGGVFQTHRSFPAMRAERLQQLLIGGLAKNLHPVRHSWSCHLTDPFNPRLQFARCSHFPQKMIIASFSFAGLLLSEITIGRTGVIYSCIATLS